MATSDDEAPGPTIDRAGKYRLGPLLGVGGMAEVFRGDVTGAEGFSRRVAIKRVLASYSANAVFARMFITEARLASMLSSACVVAVLDFDRDVEGRLFQVIEYVDGIDLETLAPPGTGAPSLPPALIGYVVQQVLTGLRHAHTASHPDSGVALGIIHRDCTPSNVLIGWDGAVKLSDFGVAKARQATFATVGSVKGKPMYMAPEQLEAAPDMDARVDLFALGVVLWELLTGRRPFAPNGEETGVSAVLAAIALYGRGDVRVDTAHAITCGAAPVALSNLAARLMAPRPAQRPASAHDALAELRACGPIATADELALHLAARFPDRAPRAAAALIARPAAHSLPTNVAIARGGPVVEVRTIVGGVRPRDARGGRRLAAAIALGAAGAVAIGGTIVVATRASDQRAPSIAAPIDAPFDASPIDASPIDAPPIGAPIDASPIDAPPTDAPPIDATRFDAPSRDATPRPRARATPSRDAGADHRPLIETRLQKDPP